MTHVTIIVCTLVACYALVSYARIQADAETARQRSVGRLYDALQKLDASLEDVRSMGLRVDAAERTVTDAVERNKKTELRVSALEMKVNGRS